MSHALTAVKDAALLLLMLSGVALRRAEAGLAVAEKASLVAFLSVMVLLSFLQVVLRQFFGMGILWGDTLSRHMVLWAGFFGAALAAAEAKHFAWETFSAQLKGRPGSAVRGLAALATAVITGLLARASWLFFLDDKAGGNILFTAAGVAVPSWAYSVVYPGGFALLTLHFLIQAALAAADLAVPGWSSAEGEGREGNA
ncbi:MAG: TRAP transporter small permease [Elusimicrobia bacterium]|nr:TRAP transporter small permease [Elusimicrobiota bacterium]